VIHSKSSVRLLPLAAVLLTALAAAFGAAQRSAAAPVSPNVAVQRALSWLAADLARPAPLDPVTASARVGAAVRALASARAAGCGLGPAEAAALEAAAHRIAAAQDGNGGWSDRGRPSVQVTSAALAGLAAYDQHVDGRFRAHLMAGVDAAIAMQQADGSWTSGDAAAIDAEDAPVTARMMSALAAARRHADAARAARRQHSLDRASAWLRANRNNSGRTGDNFEAAAALLGLQAGGATADDPDVAALRSRLLGETSRPTGAGWGEGPDAPADALRTGMVLYALAATRGAAAHERALREGLAWLVEQQAANGGWSSLDAGPSLSTAYAALGLVESLAPAPGRFTLQQADGSPTILSLDPTNGQQGQTLDVVIDGARLQNEATVDFGPGVTVNRVVLNGSKLTVNITVAVTTVVGPRDVKITNPGGKSVLKPGAFSVTSSPVPKIDEVRPASGEQGKSLNVVVHGANFKTGALVTFGNGITTNSTVVSSARLRGAGSRLAADHVLSVNITIAPTASLGPRNVTVRNPSGQSATLENAFNVLAATPPAITSVTPNAGIQGQTLDLLVKGSHFVSGAVVSFGVGVNVDQATANAAEDTLAVKITIAADAPLGPRDLQVTNPDGKSATLAGAFRVNAVNGAPVLSAVEPNSGHPGETLNVTLRGALFHAGASASLGSGIVINNVTVSSDQLLTVSVGIPQNAALGPRDVVVTNPDGQSTTLPGGFTVITPGAPRFGGLSPASAARGQRLDVRIEGSGFLSGASANFGAGILVNSAAVSSPTVMLATITVSANAAPGPRDVILINPNGLSTTAAGVFSVEGASGLRITSISPSSGNQGQTLTAVISGAGFVSGARASLGTGVTVKSTVFNAAGAVQPLADPRLTVSLVIAATAPLGSRDVIVTNPDGTSVTAPGLFTVTNNAPGKLVVSPTKVSFSNVKPGTTKTAKLKISNSGKGPLQVTLTLPSTPFSVRGSEPTFSLAPGQNVTLNVEFAPEKAGSVSGSLLIASSDPKKPTAKVTLSGSAKGSSRS